MKKIILALGLALGLAGTADAQFCSNCVYNQAAPQNAQFNITSGTVRGPFYVHQLFADEFSMGTATAAYFYGSAQFMSQLNASSLSLGTVPGARLSGTYSGLTGLGTIGTGTWQADKIGSAFGGTNHDFSSAAKGSFPYFSATGTWAELAADTAGKLLQTNGAGQNPTYTGAPNVLGTNITAIPLANLQTGTLPSGIAVQDDSLSTVSGAKVQGDINGRASGLTALLPIGGLQPGTLPTDIPASSITPTGISPGYVGGPGWSLLINYGADGRAYSVSQTSFSVSASSVAPGTLPAGVFLPAAQVLPGVMDPGVRVSSLNATGAAPGSYGGAAFTLTETMRGDGRASSIAAVPIALPLSQLNSGTLPSGVLLPAASVAAGVLPTNVQASSISATGVAPGVCGGPAVLCVPTFGVDGRATNVAQYSVPSLSTTVAHYDLDNHWTGTQTSSAAWTFYNSVTANQFFGQYLGDGGLLANLNPVNFQPGALASGVTIASAQVTGLGSFSQIAADTTTIAANLAAYESSTNGTLASLNTSTRTLEMEKVNRAGDTMTGLLTVSGGDSNANFAVFGSTYEAVGGGHIIVLSSSTDDAAIGFSTASAVDVNVALDYAEDAGAWRMNLGTVGHHTGFSSRKILSIRTDDGIAEFRNLDVTVSGSLVVGSSITGTLFGDISHATGFPSIPCGVGSGLDSVQCLGNNVTANGNFSFAAGRDAHADVEGSFVWGDNGATASASTPGTVVFQATNGFFINTNVGLTVTGPVTLSTANVTEIAFADGTVMTSTAGFGGGGSSPCAAGGGTDSVLCQGAGNTAGGADAVVSGGSSNAAGGTSSTVAGGTGNSATATYSTVSGGNNNQAAAYATVTGGNANTASGTASVVGGSGNTGGGDYSVVAGGTSNTATATEATVGGGTNNNSTKEWATIGGGSGNTASNQYDVIGGGLGNVASGLSATVAGGGGPFGANNQAVGDYSFVGGGDSNHANNTEDTVGGGAGNTAEGTDSTVGGGNGNTANGLRSTIPGGFSNEAQGESSFAAGVKGFALDDFSFVWGDSNDFNYSSHGPWTFNVEADSGVFIDTAKTVWISSGSFDLGGGLLHIDAAGDLTAINGVAYTWPASQGGASTVLTNDGSGNLSWGAGGGGSFTGGTVPDAVFFSSDIYVSGGVGLVVDDITSSPSAAPLLLKGRSAVGGADVHIFGGNGSASTGGSILLQPGTGFGPGFVDINDDQGNQLFQIGHDSITASGYLTMNAGLNFLNRTVSNLIGMTPKKLGETHFCTNCAPPKIVVSTGTAVGNWSDAVGGPFQ